MDRTELEHRMGYHKMSAEGDIKFMAELRQKCIDLGTFMIQGLPEGRCTSVAITHLEDSLMWAVKALGEPIGAG